MGTEIYSKTDERALVEDVLNGKTGKFSQIIDNNKRLVAHIVNRMISRESDREDICQDVFLKVYQNLEKFEFQSKLSTWISRIAYNTCLNFIDKKKADLYDDQLPEGESIETTVADSSTPFQWTTSRQTSVKMCEEIDRLPTVYGLILSLYHLQEMSYLEIGAMLDLPIGTVKSYLFRARKMLKDRISSLALEEGLCA